ncbi:ketopantoate reductase family protein [Tsuneonella sp. HG222]
MKQVVIVGAGAMGCLLAARLAETGAHVTLVDIDKVRLAAIALDGITLDDDHGVRTVPVNVATAAELTAAPDLVVLFTKALHTDAAVRSITHLAGPNTYALTLQNGIGNAEEVAKSFMPERVLLGTAALPSNLDGPTQISSHGTGHIRLGPLTPQGMAGAVAAEGLLNDGGFDCRLDMHIEVAVWEKLAFNAALNPLGAVTGLANGGLDTPEGRRIANAIVAETVATAASRGLFLDEKRIRHEVEHALTHHRDHRASMLQDRLAGRHSEIEAINGAIVRAAESSGVAAPVTATLADLMRLLTPDTLSR